MNQQTGVFCRQKTTQLLINTHIHLISIFTTLLHELFEVRSLSMKRTRAAYCRIFQFIMRLGSAILPWRQPKLLEGAGAVTQLSHIIAAKKLQSVLIVTDRQLLSLGLLTPLLEGLEKVEIRYAVYDGVQPNPTIDNVEEALAVYHKNSCQGIVVFGGGSPIDCAKACAARVVRPRLTVSRMRGLFKVLHKMPPFFAIPTTAGTGSETTVTAVITDSKSHHKYTINDISLIPHYAVLDPLLTVGLPQHITATTGLDALTHAIEAYIGKSTTKQTRKWATEAVKLVFENLYNAYMDGSDIRARENMLRASYLAGAAFTRAYVGYVHAIAHTLGGFYNVPHGLANAVILVQMLERYGQAVYKPLAELAQAVGIQGDTTMERAVRFTEAIKALGLKMNIPRTFDVILKDDISKMASYADQEANPLYPVPVLMDKTEISAVIESLMESGGDQCRLKSYTGKIADVDLSAQTVGTYRLTDDDRQRYLGGKGVAAKILFDNLSSKTDAFSAENIIVVTTGPLTGTGAPSSSRFNISTISPLTGLCVSSNSGGDFGYQLKRCGYDGLILRGSSQTPVYLDISDDGSIVFRDAETLVGKLISEVCEALGKPNIAIGPAGENKVLYASVMSGERACGRGGIGAVFGDKNLKAVCAKGTGRTETAMPEQLKKYNQKWINRLKKHLFTGERCPQLGTAMLVRPMQKRAQLATKNFEYGRFDDFEKISGETLRDKYLVKNDGCITCPIRCSRVVKMEGKQIKGPELETIGLLGSNLMNSNMELIIKLNHMMDEYGMDTMSAGGTLAFAMHLAEQGIADFGLRFGETDRLEEMVKKIAYRDGDGAVLADGTRVMAQKYGSASHAINVKGLELAAYNPKNAFGQGLSYATANRGACHLNGGYLVFLEGLGLATNHRSTASKAALGVMFQRLMEAVSSAGICLFTTYAVIPSLLLKDGLAKKIASGVLSISGPIIRFAMRHPSLLNVNLSMIPYSKAVQLATGMKMSLGRFISMGKNAYELERRLNIRQGLTSGQDTLPDTLKKDIPIDKMVKKYYKTMGWEM